MSRTSPHYLGDDAALCHEKAKQRKEHWPFLCTALLVLVPSAALWVLIIMGIRWFLF